MAHLSLKHWLILIAILLAGIVMGIRELRRMPDGRLHFYALDIGQGDSLLLVTPSGRTVLMDGGPDLTALTQLSRILPTLSRRIDLLILSHPHLDHLGSFPEILRRYDVGAVLMSGVRYSGGTYHEMLAEMKNHHVPLIVPDSKKDIDLGDGVIIDVLAPSEFLLDKTVSEDTINNTSIVVRALYKEQAILLTGDMEEPEENEVLMTGADVRSTVLKVAHHGSKTSTSTGFLMEVHPQVAVISAGRNNKFKHPNDSTLVRLDHFGIPYHVTAKEGTIHLQW